MINPRANHKKIKKIVQPAITCPDFSFVFLYLLASVSVAPVVPIRKSAIK